MNICELEVIFVYLSLSWNYCRDNIHVNGIRFVLSASACIETKAYIFM